MKINTRISSDNFIDLINTFKQNGWDIPEMDSLNESRFNRFCERLSILDSQEQALVIELTKNFTVINGNDYISQIIGLLNQLNEQKLDLFINKKKFFILPLIAPKDKAKTKSSSFMWYYFKDERIKYNQLFKSKQLIYYDPTNFHKLKNLGDDDAVILLDDYVGSGETAIEAINWLSNKYNINQSNIIVLTIAAQKQGMDAVLEQCEVHFFTHLIRQKGMTDVYSKNELDDKVKIMNSIEQKLKIENKFHFGYNESEALISLIRTPNNTFPVFWKTDEKNAIAPFPRN